MKTHTSKFTIDQQEGKVSFVVIRESNSNDNGVHSVFNTLWHGVVKAVRKTDKTHNLLGSVGRGKDVEFEITLKCTEKNTNTGA